MDAYGKYFEVQLERLRAAIENGLGPVIDDILGEEKFKSTLKWKDSHSGENRAKLVNVAVCNNDVDVVRLLLGHGITIEIDELRSRVKPPLWCAVIHRVSEEIVETLIRAGADVNQRAGKYYQFNHGDTPLHAASMFGNRQLASLLLDNGANVDALNRAGESPLHLTVRAKAGGEAVARCLLGYGARIDVGRQHALLLAVDQGSVEVARAIIELRPGAIDVLGTSGRSVLHQAVRGNSGDPELLAMLVAKGIDPNVQDLHGETPLHIAAKFGKASMINALIELGANANAKSYVDLTPLSYAMSSENLATIDRLLDKGADVNLPINPQSGYTALHYACKKGLRDTVGLLLGYGADAAVATRSGKTPLSRACAKGHRQIVQTLLKSGAPIRMSSSYKTTTYPSEICQILTRHAVRRWFEGKSICKWFHQAHKGGAYFVQCRKEMRAMVESEFHEDLTFFKILTMPEDELLARMRDERLREAFEAAYTETLFPIYAGDMAERFEKVKTMLERTRVRNSAEEILNSVFRMVLPYDVLHKIVGYLSYEDLQLLDANKGCVIKLRNIF